MASDQNSRVAGEAIYFDFDSALLRNDARPELQKVAQEAKRAKAIRSKATAMSAAPRSSTWLWATRVLAPLRPIWSDSACARTGSPRSAMGSGTTRVPGHDESAWSQNRRDDFRIQ